MKRRWDKVFFATLTANSREADDRHQTQMIKRSQPTYSVGEFESARGLAHSRTLRARGSRGIHASVLECMPVWRHTGPSPLSLPHSCLRVTLVLSAYQISCGWAASHSVKPGRGCPRTFWIFEMFREVSRARAGPVKSLAEPGRILSFALTSA